MHKAVHDQASGLRNLMCLGQPIDSMTIPSLEDLHRQIDGLGFASFQAKLDMLKIPMINLLDSKPKRAPLDILNASRIVLHINQSSESIKAAFAIVKLLSKSTEDRELGFLVQASSETKSKTIFHNIKMAANAFHHIHSTYLGCLVPGNTYISAHNSDI
jgi:hypothetical protein